MQNFFNKCKPTFLKHKNTKHIEFEFRLGKFNGNMFDTNIGKDNFQKILKALQKYQGWEAINESNTTSYYKGKTRMTIDENSESTVTVNKVKIDTVNEILAGKPLDVRFAVSTEEPTTIDDVMDFVRSKHRRSFVRKNLSIDMTVVTGDPNDLDDESEESYEVELEIIDPKLVNTDTKFYNLLYKVECVMNTLTY